MQNLKLKFILKVHSEIIYLPVYKFLILSKNVTDYRFNNFGLISKTDLFCRCYLDVRTFSLHYQTGLNVEIHWTEAHLLKAEKEISQTYIYILNTCTNVLNVILDIYRSYCIETVSQ